MRIALQSLAARVDLEAVPEALRADVRSRLTRVPAVEQLSWKEVERVLGDAWGAPPARVLASLDRSPAAVRPASQVHRGVTSEGRAVAVKLLRPGIAAAVRSDLGLADAVVALLGGVAESLDVGAVAGEVRERVLDELDLEYEGSVQRGFHRALRRNGELGVPAVDSELTHETVLVSDWVDGVAVADLCDGAERERAARLLLRFHLGAALHGTVDADPDVRDALLDADGRLWIVDLGASRAVAPERVALAASALDALATDDAHRLGAIVAELGWLSARDARAGLPVARRLLLGLLDGEARLDAAASRAVAERALASEDELVALALRGSVAPEDVWPLRMLGTLFAELAKLGATADWVELAREALRDGW